MRNDFVSSSDEKWHNYIDKQIIMKLTKRLIPLLILGLFLISACDDSGIGIATGIHNHSFTEDVETPTENQPQIGVSSGGTSITFDKDDEEENQPDIEEDIIVPSEPEEDNHIEHADQLLIFSLRFIRIVDENYAYVSYSEDPLDENYNFSYYMVNGKTYHVDSISKDEYKE